jgi:hypothetical protein
MPPDEFLQAFGASDGIALSLQLLRDALSRQDPTDLELALIVGFTFGFGDDHLPLLVDLCFFDWHPSHEDVVSDLAALRSPASVDALIHAAEWVPTYLDFEHARALATKAVWALGSISGNASTHALESLRYSDSTVVAQNAEAQLERGRQ